MEASLSPLDLLSKIASEQIRITLQGDNQQLNSSDCCDSDAVKDSNRLSNRRDKKCFYPKAASTPRSSMPILEVKQHSVTMTIPRASSTDSSESENMPVKRQKISRENGVDSRKTRENQVEHRHCLTEEIRKCISSTLRSIMVGCDEDKFESLIEEINSFILSLYSKGYFDVIKTENQTQEIPNPPTPETSRSSSSYRNFNTSKNSRKISHKKTVKKNIKKETNNSNSDLVPIGDGHAAVPGRLLRCMNWSSHTTCTRKLLTALFSREVLATHSLTGKASPAFPNKPAKKKLDSLLVNDIIQTVVDKCGVSESQVRTSITTKCADECKMSRSRALNNRKTEGHNSRKNLTYPSTSSDKSYFK